ncbi:MAG: class I SAM-dependent methyltransferase [Candidatus Woesearchaeota archaeon]
MNNKIINKNKIKKNRMNFNDLAPNYDKCMNKSFYNLRIRLLTGLIKKINPEYVLEVGCGTGIFLDNLSSHFKKGFGIDVSSEMIRMAETHHKKPNLNYLVCKDETIPFSNSKFDLVLSQGVIEYVNSPKKHIDEMLRVLKKNGYLVLITLNGNMSIPYKILEKIGKAIKSPKFRDLKMMELRNLIDYKGAEVIVHKILFFNPMNFAFLNPAFDLVNIIVPKFLKKYMLGMQYLVVRKKD